ncbi:MAG: porin family protein [Bacteroidales bacterium]|jgi:hypothetical protein|nr:porin family protein [Bacteroidales bacterium]
MKKIIVILFLLFIAAENYGQFTFGPKIGYNAAKLSTDFDTIKESVKSTFQIGAFARLGKKLYVQPELYYATSGGSFKIEGTTLKQDIRMNNICVPVLVGYKVINAKVINLRVMAGPVATFIINKKVTTNDLIQYPLQKSDLKNIAWGLDLGAGADIFFLSLDIRYEIGLNNIYIIPENATDNKIKSNLFIVSLGFKLI